MRGARWLLLAAGLVVLGLGPVEPGAGQEKQRDKATLVKLDNLESRTPADWHEEKPDNQMRLKQFRLSPIGDDKDDAEVASVAGSPLDVEVAFVDSRLHATDAFVRNAKLAGSVVGVFLGGEEEPVGVS